jgi:hypothetical protein
MNEDHAQSATATVADSPERPIASDTNGSDAFDPAQHHEEIARTAYALWEARGCSEGSHDADWFRAEAEVRRLYGAPDAGPHRYSEQPTHEGR